MPEKNRIEKGDIVNVYYGDSDESCLLGGKVLHTPVATGDTWVVRDAKGILHHIMSFQEIILVTETVSVEEGMAQ